MISISLEIPTFFSSSIKEPKSYRKRLYLSKPNQLWIEHSNSPVVRAETWILHDPIAICNEQNFLRHNTLIEIFEVKQALKAVKMGFGGIILRGSEGGGIVSNNTTFVFLQKVLQLLSQKQKTQNFEIIARGGIGFDTATACIAMGATGIWLDSQLLHYSTSDRLLNFIKTISPFDSYAFSIKETTHYTAKYRTFAKLATKLVLKLRSQLQTSQKNAKEKLTILRKYVTNQTPLRNSSLLPIGQDLILGANWPKQYPTLDNLTDAIFKRIARRKTINSWPWAESQGIAQTNHTKYPLHQGPMAHVSDTPIFAKMVAKAGALPWLALGNMPPNEAKKRIENTQKLCKDLSFGVGIIGLNSNIHRDSHIQLIKTFRPPMAMIAAGNFEQANDLTKSGILTYLHTPSNKLFLAAFHAGHRHFILEGNEAGGHIGTLSGFVLWQQCLNSIQEHNLSNLDLVFAGGIGTAKSAHAMAALVGFYSQSNVRFGLQMGTAYLLTKEAIDSKAVHKTYQDVALKSDKTRVIGETIHMQTRVLDTNQARFIQTREKKRQNENLSLHKRKHHFEQDNHGGLRIAAKAQLATTNKQLSVELQKKQGLFHAGQGFTLLNSNSLLTIQTLHEQITKNSNSLTKYFHMHFHKCDKYELSKNDILKSDEIVIVGLGCVLPDAHDVPTFWKRLQEGHCAIKKVPNSYWDPDLYYSADRTDPTKTYSIIGGFVDDFVLNRKLFRIPPSVLPTLDRSQKIALEAARQALTDAQLLDPTRKLDQKVDKERFAVIIGNVNGGDLRIETAFQLRLPEIDEHLRQTLDQMAIKQAAKIRETFAKTFLLTRSAVTEDTLPGELPNVIAGRIANAFDLCGPNLITDAACASSLAAIDVAVEQLHSHKIDAALVGGAEAQMGVDAYIKFCRIGALSPDGSRPFDQSANGFVMAEGAVMMVIMRRKDAQRLNLRMYATIKGVGSAADGAGKGITAPNPKGQQRALQKAYINAKIDPSTVTMIEAHGTSTIIGDPTELQSLAKITRFSHTASLGSVKSNLGHLKAAAGAAGILKTILSLYHKTLVPTLGVTNPHEDIPFETLNLYPQQKLEPWIRKNHSRRAGVSAFGFGGTNVHVVLEEIQKEEIQKEEIQKEEIQKEEIQKEEIQKNIENPSFELPISKNEEINSKLDHNTTYQTLLNAICKRTGYTPDEIEPNYELEADLGIDSVKQAEIIIDVRKQLTSNLKKTVQIEQFSTYSTISQLANEFDKQIKSQKSQNEHYQALLNAICKRTGYTPDEIEPNYELEADLGIDSVKQAEIMIELRKHFALSFDQDFLSAEHSTIQQIAQYLSKQTNQNYKQEKHKQLKQEIVAQNAQIAGIALLEAETKEALAEACANVDEKMLAKWREKTTLPLAKANHRVVITFDPTEENSSILTRFSRAQKAILTGKKHSILANQGIFIASSHPKPGKVAFLFPGQGTQYLNMGKDLFEYKTVQEIFAEADRSMMPRLKKKLSTFMHPSFQGSIQEISEQKKAAFKTLSSTEITQPAVLTMDIALLRLLEEFGIKPDAVVGHSLGEYAAIVAAGVMDFDTALHTAARRGSDMAETCKQNDSGAMMAVSLSVAEIQKYLDQVEHYVVCANKNSPKQTIVAGSTKGIKELETLLQAKGFSPLILPVSHAFHTKLVAPASIPLRKHFSKIQINSPIVPIISNVTGTFYSDDVTKLTETLSHHVFSPVEFIAGIKKLYHFGVRTFIEVGPKRAQTGFVKEILADLPHNAFFTNHPKLGGITSLRRALGKAVLLGIVAEKRTTAFLPQFVVYKQISNEKPLIASLKPAIIIGTKTDTIAALWKNSSVKWIQQKALLYKSTEKELFNLVNKDVQTLICFIQNDEIQKQKLTSLQIARFGFFLARSWARKYKNKPDQNTRLVFITENVSALIVGSITGLVRSLHKEWKTESPVVQAVHMTSLSKQQNLLSNILSQSIKHIVVSFLKQKTWIEVDVPIPQKQKNHELKPQQNWHWLVTGGAKGITAEIVRIVAKRFGGHFVLVGRTEEQNLKTKILSEIRDLGGKVEYKACDLTDKKAINTLLNSLKRTAFNVIIHGAGIEISRSLLQKDPLDFERIFQTKLSIVHLWENLEQKPDHLIAFSSVAGRYGNIGQQDYSAANNALARWIDEVTEKTNTRGLTIDWTAWADIGMAARNNMPSLLQARGVELLPLKTGIANFINLFTQRTQGEVVVRGNLVNEQSSKLKEKTLTFTLDPKIHSFLNDHRIDGVAVLPGVIGMELFAHASKEIGCFKNNFSFENVRFLTPLRFHREKPVEIQVQIAVLEPNKTCVAQLRSKRVLAKGKTQTTTHFSATIVKQNSLFTTLSLNQNVTWWAGMDQKEIYQALFHTGSFRLLTNIPYARPDQIIALGLKNEIVSHITDPFVTEMALQTAGMLSMLDEGISMLPIEIKNFRISRSVQKNELLTINAQIKKSNEQERVFDVDVLDSSKKIVQQLRGCKMIQTERINKKYRPKYGEIMQFNLL